MLSQESHRSPVVSGKKYTDYHILSIPFETNLVNNGYNFSQTPSIKHAGWTYIARKDDQFRKVIWTAATIGDPYGRKFLEIKWWLEGCTPREIIELFRRGKLRRFLSDNELVHYCLDNSVWKDKAGMVKTRRRFHARRDQDSQDFLPDGAKPEGDEKYNQVEALQRVGYLLG